MCIIFLNGFLPVDDFEFRTDQFLPVSIYMDVYSLAVTYIEKSRKKNMSYFILNQVI